LLIENGSDAGLVLSFEDIRLFGFFNEQKGLLGMRFNSLADAVPGLVD
jgi:hypothetical protein